MQIDTCEKGEYDEVSYVFTVCASVISYNSSLVAGPPLRAGYMSCEGLTGAQF